MLDVFFSMVTKVIRFYEKLSCQHHLLDSKFLPGGATEVFTCAILSFAYFDYNIHPNTTYSPAHKEEINTMERHRYCPSVGLDWFLRLASGVGLYLPSPLSHFFHVFRFLLLHVVTPVHKLQIVFSPSSPHFRRPMRKSPMTMPHISPVT